MLPLVAKTVSLQNMIFPLSRYLAQQTAICEFPFFPFVIGKQSTQNIVIPTAAALKCVTICLKCNKHLPADKV